MSTRTEHLQAGQTESPAAGRLFGAVVGLASLAVLLQAVWAGVFIREGRANNETWVHVHSVGGNTALGLAVIAAVIALLKLRQRGDLVAGSVAFAVLLGAEVGLGGLIGDHPAVQEIHFPLAMALMGLAVWLPLRSRHGR